MERMTLSVYAGINVKLNQFKVDFDNNDSDDVIHFIRTCGIYVFTLMAVLD